MNIFCITADYRKDNQNKPKYYVAAKNKIDAKKKYLGIMPWMKIYDCVELTEEERKEFLSKDKMSYILF